MLTRAAAERVRPLAATTPEPRRCTQSSPAVTGMAPYTWRSRTWSMPVSSAGGVATTSSCEASSSPEGLAVGVEEGHGALRGGPGGRVHHRDRASRRGGDEGGEAAERRAAHRDGAAGGEASWPSRPCPPRGRSSGPRRARRGRGRKPGPRSARSHGLVHGIAWHLLAKSTGSRSTGGREGRGGRLTLLQSGLYQVRTPWYTKSGPA